jgi:3-dehydroquinate synthase class II
MSELRTIPLAEVARAFHEKVSIYYAHATAKEANVALTLLPSARSDLLRSQATTRLVTAGW